MNKNFSDLGISPPILKAIEEMGFQTPTEVQSKVIPHILNREDLIVMSKTGSGKTAVFGIPLLQLTDPGVVEPQGLILTPTRELAVQIDSDLKKMSQYLSHKTLAVYGQHSMDVEIQALKKGASIVTGTPGRVFDHIRHGNLKVKQIRFLVLDEADRMLDMGFIDQVFKIIKTLTKGRITLLFSATIPTEIQRICQGYMRNPVTIEIESQTKTVDTIDQTYYRVNRNEKRTQLHRLLMIERPESCLIFCNTRYAVDQVQSFLLKKGYASQALHGDVPQGKRLKIMQQFKEGAFHLLVATDVAARGIHIDDLSLVINYDVPLEKDNYVHRIGRTGRAGKGGRAISFVTGEDIMSLYAIEEHTGAMIAESELPTESEFNACQAESERWIQEKFKSSKLISDPGAKDSQNKRTQTKPAAPQEKHRDRYPKGQNREPNRPYRDGNAHTKEENKPYRESSKPTNEANRPNRDPNRSYRESNRPYKETRAESPKEHSHPVQTMAASAPTPKSVEEKTSPLLQRMLKKILGK